MREAIVLDLGDIGAQAARIRAQAETQAAQIIADAQAKSEQLADQLHDQAKTQGHAEGYEAGLVQGREQGHAEALEQSAAQLAQLAAAWSQVAQDWEQQRAEMEREARQAVLDFAMATAEKLVHRVIEVDETVVIDQAAQALSLVLSAHDASVCVHPVDKPILEDALPQLLSELSNMQHIELVEDEAITPGGCVVAFGQGRIDATIERQMQRLVDLIVPAPPPIEEDEPAPTPAPAAEDTAVPTLDPVDGIAPVYEITEQGLVEAGPMAPPETQAPQVDPFEGLDEPGDPTTDSDESEA